MDQRKAFILEYDLSELPVRALCVKYGIAPKTAYKWLHRADEYGLREGLKDRARGRVAMPSWPRGLLGAAVGVGGGHGGGDALWPAAFCFDASRPAGSVSTRGRRGAAPDAGADGKSDRP